MLRCFHRHRHALIRPGAPIVGLYTYWLSGFTVPLLGLDRPGRPVSQSRVMVVVHAQVIGFRCLNVDWCLVFDINKSGIDHPVETRDSSADADAGVRCMCMRTSRAG